MKSLDVYQINILQNLLLTYKSKHNLAPAIFQEKFKPINHKYLTKHASENFYLSKSSIKTSNFRFSYRGPYLCNNFPSSETKTLASFHAFKNHIKNNYLAMIMNF